MKCRTLFLLVALFALVAVCTFPCVAHADQTAEEELTDSVGDALDGLDLTDFSEAAADYIDSVTDKILALASGEFDDVGSVFALLAEIFVDGLAQTLPALLSVFAVTVICGLCRKTADSLVSQGTAEVVSFVGIAVICVTLVGLLAMVYAQVSTVVDKICALSDAASPVMLTLLVACGGGTVMNVCQPGVVVFGSVILNLVRNVVLPLTLFGSMFALVGNLSGSMRVEKLSGFLSGLSGWVIGVVFMVYSAYTSVAGITAASIDGVSVRMAKFAAKNYIPILGGYVADGFDTVLAGATIVKNCFGAVALFVLLVAVIRPVAAVLCVSLGLQAVSAVAEPIAEQRTIKLLSAVGKTLSMYVAVIAAVAFMFALQFIVAICCASGV